MIKLLVAYLVALWLFVAVGAVYVCVQLAAAKSRNTLLWGAFGFCFGVFAAVLLYMLPAWTGSPLVAQGWLADLDKRVLGRRSSA